MKTFGQPHFRTALASAAVLALLAGGVRARQPEPPAESPEAAPTAPAAEPASPAAAPAAPSAAAGTRGTPSKAGSGAGGESGNAGAGNAAMAAAAPSRSSPANRRPVSGDPTALGFRNVSVDQIIPFIVESTGKVVMPQQDVLNRKVTILNDQKIPREDALDLVFQALQQIGVAVVETPYTISLRDIAEITRQDVPVIGPEESTLTRRDLGNFAEKVYRLRSATAKAMGDVLKAGLPDFAKMTIDEESNQIAIMGNIALLQRIEQKIISLDRPSAAALQTETFRLQFQDASAVKENIEELFGGGSSTTRRNQNNQGNRGQQNFGFRGPGGQEGQPSAAASEIRVTANTSQNSITVAADPAILAQIREQVKEWDRAMDPQSVIPKIYDLKYSDPVKVAAILDGMFNKTSGSRSTTNQNNFNGGNNQFGGNNQGNTTPASGLGAGRLANQFSFQPMADTGRLVVVAKAPDNIKLLDKLIQDIDQPQNSGLPSIIELKHASAEDLAEQLNALLAQDGTAYPIKRAETGLANNSANSSPFATSTTTTDQNGNQTTDSQSTNNQTMPFWWQRSRPPTDRHNASNLIGQLRIVPIWRQNALMIVAPPEYKQSIADLVAQLDKPGRQVLISAIVAEISREDATALGLRWSSQALTPSNPDNSISVGNGVTGTKNNFINSLFDTSVLTTNVNLNFLLQALAQKTDVSILSEPKIFTSDNQEAEFFDGQDIPFITNSQTNTVGNLVQSFDYKAVGIQLRARPRITVKGDVDLKVNVELSSIIPGQTLFGGFVVDRRETTTQLIVKDKQTIVISGIMRAETSDIVRKVPLLGDIPLIGYLFKSREKSVKNTELLVFITPIVVRNTDDEELGRVNEPYVDRLNELKSQLRKAEPLRKDAQPPELLQPTAPPQPMPDNNNAGPHPAPEIDNPGPLPTPDPALRDGQPISQRRP